MFSELSKKIIDKLIPLEDPFEGLLDNDEIPIIDVDPQDKEALKARTQFYKDLAEARIRRNTEVPQE